MRERFRNALASKLGQVITPELAAWLECNAFYGLKEVGILAPPDQFVDDRQDYERFMAEYGFTQESVNALMASQPVNPMPDGFDQVTAGESKLHGIGMFATRTIQAGEIIAPARIDGIRTPAGRFTNHARRPNAKFVRLHSDPNADLDMVATKTIHGGDEIFIDYRQAASVNGCGLVPLDAEVEKTKRLRLMTDTPMHTKILRLEDELMMVPQGHYPIRHYFAPGIFAREITIPAGKVVTGAIHKTENLIVVSMGRVKVVTEDGTMEVSAGDTLLCKPGVKNAVVAIEDSRWTNFFHNPGNETDLHKLVEMLTESTYDELLGGSKNRQLLAQVQREKLEA